ncbi:MAG: hypothetical protein H0X62_13560, partial [Bacteroidetes bacterium]|nr:hypothetical protein [Bacteroidota bacterium]
MVTENKFDKLLILLIYLSIFLNSFVFFTTPFEFYFGYIAYIILLPFFFARYKLPRNIILLFLFLLLFGLFQVYIGNNVLSQFFKIYFGVALSYIFYYFVVIEFKYDVQKLFKWYLLGCYWVSIIAIVQYISFNIGFTLGYDYTWLFNKWGVVVEVGKIRVNSIFGEPSYLAIFLTGAVFVSFNDLLFYKNPYYFNKIKAVVIIIASVLTTSSAGYLGYFFILVIFLVNFGFIRYALIITPLALIIFVQLYNNVPAFKDRFEGSLEIFTTGKFEIGKTNGSSIILYNNYHIAVENFKENFLGTGLGSHPTAYDKHSITKHIKMTGFANNQQDANAMFNRLLSETGILG